MSNFVRRWWCVCARFLWIWNTNTHYHYYFEYPIDKKYKLIFSKQRLNGHVNASTSKRKITVRLDAKRIYVNGECVIGARFVFHSTVDSSNTKKRKLICKIPCGTFLHHTVFISTSSSSVVVVVIIDAADPDPEGLCHSHRAVAANKLFRR